MKLTEKEIMYFKTVRDYVKKDKYGPCPFLIETRMKYGCTKLCGKLFPSLIIETTYDIKIYNCPCHAITYKALSKAYTLRKVSRVIKEGKI